MQRQKPQRIVCARQLVYCPDDVCAVGVGAELGIPVVVPDEVSHGGEGNLVQAGSAVRA